jgi:hypothetical protein
MTRKLPRRWRVTVGGYGYKVTAFERTAGGVLYIRWWDRARNNWVPRSLGHRDRERAEQEARTLAGALLAANEAEHRGDLTLADLFGRFEREVIQHEKPRQAAEDRRRMAVWTASLGAARQLEGLDRAALDQFVRSRRAGTLTVPDVKLSARPTDRTIGADLEFQREDVQSEDLANRFFSQYEQRVLLETPQAERTAAFFKIWTAKEALIKAMGVGLALPLDSFDVALQPISGSLLVATRPKSSEPLAWRVQSLPAPNGYVAALATEGQVDPPQMLDW